VKCLRKDLVCLQLEGSSEAEEGVDVYGNMVGCTPVEEGEEGVDVYGNILGSTPLEETDVDEAGRWVASGGVGVDVPEEVEQVSSTVNWE
jgi:hypothetical protein